MLNVDMEDPPSQNPVLLRHLESDPVDVMFGLRRERRGVLSVRVTSLIFNRVLNKATGYDPPLNTATLRIMSRQLVDAYNSLAEKSHQDQGPQGKIRERD